jgi:ABC-2 type transport system ATP-binding protein
MKTQLSLAIALSINPKLLMLDEPTSGLDPAVKKHILKIIMEDAAENDITIFFSTHNMNDLERMSDRVGLLMKGKLIFNNSLENLKKNNTKIQVVLDEEIPEKIKVNPNVIKYEKLGRMNTINFTCDKETSLSYFKELNPVYIEAVDVSLEDIFINIVEKEGYTHEEFNK